MELSLDASREVCSTHVRDQTRCERVTSGTHQAVSNNTLTRPHVPLYFFLIAFRLIAGWHSPTTRIAISYNSVPASQRCRDVRVFTIVMNYIVICLVKTLHV